MFRVLFFLFIVVPIIEIAVLMQVGALLGAWPTVAIVIITAWLGAKNVRQQGIATIQSVQTKMAQGEAPSDEIVAGLLLLVAGVLLVTPGFVTDFFGLSLLIPQVRSKLIKSVQQHLVQNPSAGGAQFHFYQQSSEDFQQKDPFAKQDPLDGHKSVHHGQTIEGDFERKD